MGQKSAYIQERPSSERKRQKPDVLTSHKIGELPDKPSERKENDAIVLSNKQETCLKDIYCRMPNEAEQLIADGFHNDAFDVVLPKNAFRTICGFLDKRSR